jgi:hypothetical protein
LSVSGRAAKIILGIYTRIYAFPGSRIGSMVGAAYWLQEVLGSPRSGKKNEIFGTACNLTRVQFPTPALKFACGFLCVCVNVRQYLKSPVILFERRLSVYHGYINMFLIILKGV